MNILEAIKQLRDDLKSWATKNLQALDAKIDSKTIPVDEELNAESANPVQNKAIANKFTEVNAAIEAAKEENILDDESDKFEIVDPNGYKVLEVNKDGLTTTEVHAKDVTVDGTSIAEKMTEWDSKSGFSGDYNDLTNKPEIVDDKSEKLEIADPDGHVVARVDEAGISATDFNIIEEDGDKSTSLKEKMATFATTNDVSALDNSLHKVAKSGNYEDLNNKPTLFSGDYNDLTNKPIENESVENETFAIVDKDGYKVAEISAEGLYSTILKAKDKVVTPLVEVNGKSFDGTYDSLDGSIPASDLPVVPIEKGGMGATTAAAARTNLEVYSKNEVVNLNTTLKEELIGTVDDTSDKDTIWGAKKFSDEGDIARLGEAQEYADEIENHLTTEINKKSTVRIITWEEND